MPVNTSSTGATYGKSSDPLCPLGFHPQVRWPTRCKRCFRDYKEHSDDRDRAKFSSLSRSGTGNDNASTAGSGSFDATDPWAPSSIRSGFQKSKSLDVGTETSTRYSASAGAGLNTSAASSRFGASTTATAAASGGASGVAGQEDIPDWRRAMLERQQQRERNAFGSTFETSTSGSSSSAYSPSSKDSLQSTSHYASRMASDDSSRMASLDSSPSISSASSNLYRGRRADSEDHTLLSSYLHSVPPSSGNEDLSRGNHDSNSSLSKLGTASSYFSGSSGATSQGSTSGPKLTFSNPISTTAPSPKASSTTSSSSGTSSYSWSSSTAVSKSSTSVTSPPSTSQSSWNSSKASSTEVILDEGHKKAVPAWKRSLVKKDEDSSKTASRTESGRSSAGGAEPQPGVTAKPVPAWKRQTASSATTSSSMPSQSTSGSTLGSGNQVGNGRVRIKSVSSMDSSDDENPSSPASIFTSKRSLSSLESAKAKKAVASTAEVENLMAEVQKLKESTEALRKERDDLLHKRPLSFETAKASETASELLKAKEKLREQEANISSLEMEKKGLNLKLREVESMLEKRPQASETQKTIMELETKLKYLEKKSAVLEKENSHLQNNVQNLEGELEEVQDNFREDEADEYRHLKRDLEVAAKNCRVLQFKLKKAEKTIVELQSEAERSQKPSSATFSGKLNAGDSNRLRQLEKELDQKNQLNAKLEQQVAELQRATSAAKRGTTGPGGGGGPVLSRTGSVERNIEDQLLKDLQDSIERENDLKEQLNMAEEEGTEMRKKLSRLEDENESLAGQVKRMATSSSSVSRGSRGTAKGVPEGEQLSPAELKVQLEVAEGETSILRKKVENLLTDNLKLTKEVKDLNGKLSQERRKRLNSSSLSSGSGGSFNGANGDPAAAAASRLDDLQDELNGTRIKLIEKEREVERLDSQLKAATAAAAAAAATSGRLKRSGSQEDDLQRKLDVIEKEAAVLRERNAKLEAENEKLNGQSGGTIAGNLRRSSSDRFSQMEKASLEDKVRTLESKVTELDRVKREKASLESELERNKSSLESERKKAEKLEREASAATDKSERAQRELIAAEREKRRAEEDKSRLEEKVSRLELEARQAGRERDRYREEVESARQKNRDNLSQTQEGIKAFKEQIESLKGDLQEERSKHREVKRTSEDKVRQLQGELRGLKQEADDRGVQLSDAEAKLKDLEDKWAKSKRINQQRKDKVEALEKQLAEVSSAESAAGSKAHQTRTRDLEAKVEELTKARAALEAELAAAKPSRGGSGSGSGRGDKNLEEAHREMKADYDTLKSELAALRSTYNTKADEWIKEKLELQQRMQDLGESLRSTAGGEGWEGERERFKNIIEDRDSQITQLKIEGDVARSQTSGLRKECDELKLKLADYEKMSKFQRVVSSSSAGAGGGSSSLFSDEQGAAAATSVEELTGKLEDLRKQLTSEQRDHRSELNNMRMKLDSKVALAGEELSALKTQCAKYRREREHYKEMLDSAQRPGSRQQQGGSGGGGEATTPDNSRVEEFRQKVSDLTYRTQVLEDELSEAKMEAARYNANSIALKSTYEVRVAELNSRINELEEEALIESGRARIAGTRTKMELAWQKERESQKKLINELNTMSRDLKSTLLEVEKERDRERLESKRKIEGMKSAFAEEQEDTKKQITDLQYDLLELRDAHAKLRTTNEKLRRDKDKAERDREEYRQLNKERTRGEQGEEKKVLRLLGEMQEFLANVPKVIFGVDIDALPSLSSGSGSGSSAARGGGQSTLDNSAKAALKDSLLRLKGAKEELENLHKLNQEEKERTNNARKALIMKRTGSAEPEASNGGADFRGGSAGRSVISSASSGVGGGAGGRRLYRKTVSVGDTLAEADSLWKSQDSSGSRESLASNASIPLPVPVRTRSAHGGGGSSESGYSSTDTYNAAMSIRRLERDTSVDRLSTGSRESAMSTQSEWVAGDKSTKQKKAGLISKLKKLTRKSEEKDLVFGSGSDISSVASVSSAMSAFQKAQAQKKTSLTSGKASAATGVSSGPFGSGQLNKKANSSSSSQDPAQANAPFDKYFGNVTSTTPSRFGSSSGPSSSSTSTYRRF